MKNYLLIFVAGLITTLVFFSFSVHAQTSEFDQLLNAFKSLYKSSTDCDPRLKDSQGNCVRPDDVIQACLNEGKRNKAGQIDPACCLTNEQCEANRKPGDPVQTCTIGNDYCKSGFSCDDHKTNRPGTNPAPTNSGTVSNPTGIPQPSSSQTNNPNLGSFTYYCQSDVRWQNNGCYQYDLTYNGCCPTAASMVMNSLGVSMDPVRMDRIFRNKGLRACGGYCKLASDERVGNKLFIEDVLRQNGLGVGPDLVVWNPQAGKSYFDVDAAQAALARGNYILAYVGKYPAGKCCEGRVFNGHAFAIDKIICPTNDKSQCKIRVRDPSNCGSDFKEGTEERFMYRNVSLLTDNGAFPIGRIQ